MSRILLEICIDSVNSARAAEQGAADRLELCSALSEGGLTPGYGLTNQVLQATQLPVMMMIRPRGGSFVYDADEIDVLRAEIDAAKSLGVAGVVFGALTETGDIDIDTCQSLRERAQPLWATFHRAFDESRGPRQALQQLIDLGFDRVLTSGQQATAEKGVELLRQLVGWAAGRIVIMAGAGLRPSNAAAIVAHSQVTEVHGTAAEWVASPDGSPRRATSMDTVAAIRSAIDSAT